MNDLIQMGKLDFVILSENTHELLQKALRRFRDKNPNRQIVNIGYQVVPCTLHSQVGLVPLIDRGPDLDYSALITFLKE
jgi:hypothetical protein